MDTIWIVVALGIAGAVVALVMSWRRGYDPADLGAVSYHWITEHRLGPKNDSRR